MVHICLFSQFLKFLFIIKDKQDNIAGIYIYRKNFTMYEGVVNYELNEWKRTIYLNSILCS